MSKSNKNQKSITSFFKNPAQPPAPKTKSPPPPVAPQEIKKEEEEIPAPPPAPKPTAKAVSSPKKPAVIVCPSTTNEKQPANETDWINLSDRFLLTNRNFEVQYAHLYAERLGAMRKLVGQAAENRWG
jgi:hypothetical protein